MLTVNEIKAIVYKIKYRDWVFHVSYEAATYVSDLWLQVHFMAQDTESNSFSLQKCRKWRLSVHMTETEIVRTAWKALLAAVEHEAGEEFLYDGVAIYNPHIDVQHLRTAGGLTLDRRAPTELEAELAKKKSIEKFQIAYEKYLSVPTIRD